MSNVLVIRALELVGRRIANDGPRSRRGYFSRGERLFHEAHTYWRPSESDVDHALRQAWDIVPHVLSQTSGVAPKDVETLLDRYTRDLLENAARHTPDKLADRFQQELGLEVRRDGPHDR